MQLQRCTSPSTHCLALQRSRSLSLNELICLPGPLSSSPLLFAASKQLMGFQPVGCLWCFLIGFLRGCPTISQRPGFGNHLALCLAVQLISCIITVLGAGPVPLESAGEPKYLQPSLPRHGINFFLLSMATELILERPVAQSGISGLMKVLIIKACKCSLMIV